MIARVAGGALAGWLLSLAPLVVVDALSLTSGVIDPSSTALVGALALSLGIALGGLAAGLIGGRHGGVAGSIAGALFAACLIALMYTLRAQGKLPNLVAMHPVRTMGALAFIGALLAGVALLASALMGLRSAPAVVRRRDGPAPDTRIGGPRQRDVSRPGSASHPARGASQPRPDARELTPARRMDQGWGSDPRRAPPVSGSHRAPSQPARRPEDATRYDERGRRPDVSSRW